MSSAEVIFNVFPPSGTSPSADLELVLLDPVTGLDYNQQHIAMTALDDGRHQARLVIPVGSLVYYRYLRRDPGPAQETDTFGDPVRYRLAHVPGPTQFEDVIAAWSDGAFEGETGRILGHVRTTAGE
jgi:hypothetical protein